MKNSTILNDYIVGVMDPTAKADKLIIDPSKCLDRFPPSLPTSSKEGKRLAKFPIFPGS
jgi:hypothetical protein